MEQWGVKWSSNVNDVCLAVDTENTGGEGGHSNHCCFARRFACDGQVLSLSRDMAVPAHAASAENRDLGDDVLFHIIGALAKMTFDEVPMEEPSPGWWFDSRHKSRLTRPRLVSTQLRGVFDAWWCSNPASRFWQHTAQRTLYGVLVGRCAVAARDLVLPRLGPPPINPTNFYLMAIEKMRFGRFLM